MGGGFVKHESTAPVSVEWFTPPWVYEALDCTFDMDPASPGLHRVPWSPARRHLTKKEDGLASPWEGSVWLNPPYLTRTNVKWMQRFVDHHHGIALMSSRTDAAWFQLVGSAADKLLFTDGRIEFIDENWKVQASPGAGHVFFAFGPVYVDALRRFQSKKGGVLR